MKTRLSTVLLFTLAACTPQSAGPRRSNLIGTHDLVLVGQPADGFVATKTVNAEGTGYDIVGMPSRYLFVTSADTNELRVLENYQDGVSGRSFLGAPNPLETLSIPVLDRPTMLAVDEGRNKEGSRVTGHYVYAARPGGAEVSVVSLAQRRMLNGRPFAAPGPVTALGAYMDVDQTTPVLQTPVPATTRLFVATWDGESAAVYAATIATDSAPIEKLPFERQVLIGQTPITAMVVVPPLATRTLDGVAFCATTPCLALATRADSGTTGRAFLIDPPSGRLANLTYGGPVRKLVNSANGTRIYGVLDEQACGGPACGGIVSVDVAAAVSTASGPTFPTTLDATGVPMRPMRSDGLITGLTIGAFHRTADGSQNAGTILQATQGGVTVDGGTVDSLSGFAVQDYYELGAYASSSGVITFFSGLAGSIIDADPRRSTISAASVSVPGTLQDGGTSFTGEDGGVIGSGSAATLTLRNDPSQTFRIIDVVTNEGTTWTVDLSDGYLESQTIAVIHQGQVPGLVALPTTAADGVRLAVPGGFESRAAAGDIVRFETGSEALGFTECGRSRIATIGAGFIEAIEAPASCADRVRFSVRADGLKPLVAAADLEGYLGRWAPGETLTYNRPYVLLTAGVVASRTALSITIPPTLPRGEGAFITFEVLGLLAPYQVSLDTLALAQVQGQGSSCFIGLSGQVVLGNMVMDRLPSYVTGASSIDFRWTVMGVVPSGNSLLEFPLSLVTLGPLTATNNSAICRR